MLFVENLYKNSRCFLLSTDFFFFFWPMRNNDSPKAGRNTAGPAGLHPWIQSVTGRKCNLVCRVGSAGNMHTHFLGIIP